MPEFLDPSVIHDLIVGYGYWVVLVAVGLESAGLPLPGETVLVSAAVYAGTTHHLNILLVVAFGIAGAILGDNLGYWIGRELGYPLLVRHGHRVGLTQDRFKLGRYLFHRHGGKVVFFGRFVALLRVLTALLAGAIEMAWRRFLMFNALGGIAWASLFGFGGYGLGTAIRRVSGPIGWAALGLAAIGIGLGVLFMRRNEARLIAEADRVIPNVAADRRGR